MPKITKVPIEKMRPVAFTVDYSKRMRVLAVDVGLTEAKDIAGDQPPDFTVYKAILDTGATGTAITPKVALNLGLAPIRRAMVQGAQAKKESNVYLLNVFLPNKVSFIGLPVTEVPGLAGGFDVLIGMDLINLGDLAVTHSGGKTKLSYAFPSTLSIDFVKDINRQNVKEQRLKKFKKHQKKR